MQDEDIDLSDIPEVTEEQMRNAVLRVGGKPVERGQRRVDIFLDAFIVEYFEGKAGKQGYSSSRSNEVHLINHQHLSNWFVNFCYCTS